MKSILVSILFLISFLSCHEGPEIHAQSQVDKMSSEFITDWTRAQVHLIRRTTGVGHIAYSRHFAYTGIAVYEALVHADPTYKSVFAQLNGAPVLPQVQEDEAIYYPLAANAAFEAMFSYFYGNSAANSATIDSLATLYENRFSQEAGTKYNTALSIQYGKEIAAAVIAYAQSDGSAAAGIPYTLQGEGYWEPTPPSFGNPAAPGWGNNRTLITGSIEGTLPPAPITFSAEPGSPFYLMAHEVYDVAQSLTETQKAIAQFWDDLPNGTYISAFGHWFSILSQVLEQEHTSLMQGIDAYLKLGMAMHDAGIGCWKAKYTYHGIRPVTYIRKYIGPDTWQSFIGTPLHPEYPAAHATLSAAAAEVLTSVFGVQYAFADHTYTDIGYTPRMYGSFEQAGAEAGQSRLYGGIHFRPSIDAGLLQGKQIARHVLDKLNTLNP